MNMAEPISVPFSHLINLFIAISQIPPAGKASTKTANTKSRTPTSLVNRWVENLKERQNVAPGTWGAFLRLLFPEEDAKRRYGMHETSLAIELKKHLGMPDDSFDNWRTKYSCLGEALRNIWNNPSTDRTRYKEMKMIEVDGLLDELAATSPYTDISIREKYAHKVPRRSRGQLIKLLFRPIPSDAAGFLVQILLQDLRPLLYPLSPDATVHYTTALNKYHSNAILQLSKGTVMKFIDPSGALNKAYGISAHLEDAANAVEGNELSTSLPGYGACIQIPKSQKGRNLRHALTYFPNDDVYAEIKYDGERAQIHVQVTDDGTFELTIFSKSRRNSSLDRAAVHDVIKDALGRTPPRNLKNVVLDAEMVAFDGEKIDEFWRIDELVKLTAIGPRARKDLEREVSCEEASQVTHSSPTRHLGLVFFDILLHNSVDLRNKPYTTRRSLLESLISLTPGYVQLAESVVLTQQHNDDNETSASSTLEQLKDAFANCIARHHEGLVLKGAHSFYGDPRNPWVKLKKDYIPGHGDCLDMIVFGAGYERDRATELRVPPSGFTTFYLGAVRNTKEMADDSSIKPEVYIYMTSSYGLTREQLETATFLLKTSDHVVLPHGKSAPAQRTFNLPYSFKLRRNLPLPTILLRHPLVAEVFGAGFTKEQHCSAYALRFPRITKIHRKMERSWLECLSLDEIHAIARKACGRDSDDKDMEIRISEIWGRGEGAGQLVSPPINSTPKRKRREEEAKGMLDLVDPPSPATKRIRRSQHERPAIPNATSPQKESTLALGSPFRSPVVNKQIRRHQVLVSPISPALSPVRTDEISSHCLSPRPAPAVPTIPSSTPTPDALISNPLLIHWDRLSKCMQKLLFQSVAWFAPSDGTDINATMPPAIIVDTDDAFVVASSFKEFLSFISGDDYLDTSIPEPTPVVADEPGDGELGGVCQRGIIFVDLASELSQKRLEDALDIVERSLDGDDDDDDDEVRNHLHQKRCRPLWVFTIEALKSMDAGTEGGEGLKPLLFLP